MLTTSIKKMADKACRKTMTYLICSAAVIFLFLGINSYYDRSKATILTRSAGTQTHQRGVRNEDMNLSPADGSTEPLHYVAKHVSRGCRPNLDHLKYYSQSREDFALFHNYFAYPPICNGVYVELGALDGVHISNTKFFQDTLHWSGVLIEAVSGAAKKLKHNRPNNTIFAEAVCPEGLTEVGISGSASVGGIGEYMPEGHIKHFFRQGLPPPVMVPCRPIREMLRVAGIKAIDFLSLDVEGAELMVLKTMDWSIPVKLFIVEMGRGEKRDQQLRDLLSSKGYQKTTWNIRGFCEPHRPCTVNEVFENPNYVYE